MDFTTQADFQDELFYSCLPCLLRGICSSFQRCHQTRLLRGKDPTMSWIQALAQEDMGSSACCAGPLHHLSV